MAFGFWLGLARAEVCQYSFLRLVSLMTISMVCKLPEGVMFKIWLKSDEFEGIKNPVKDQ